MKLGNLGAYLQERFAPVNMGLFVVLFCTVRGVAAVAGGASGAGQLGNWALLFSAPGPDLAAAATKTVGAVHETLADARAQLKDRVAADVAAALRQGSTRP